MRRHSWPAAVTLVVVICLFGLAGFGQETPAVIGQVAVSAETTQNGIALPSGGTVFEGDVIATGTTGRTVIKISATNQITLNENTSAVFSKVLDQTGLQLQKGTLLVEIAGKGLVVVKTPKFQIEPPIAGNSKVYVGLMADNSTYIESAEGDIVIVETGSGQSYVLPAGQNALVPQNSSGIPGLQPQVTTQAATSTGNPPDVQPAEPQPSSPQPSGPQPSGPTPSIAQKPAPHGSGALIGVIAAAGAAGGIAAAAGGGGGNGGGGGPPASPSSP